MQVSNSSSVGGGETGGGEMEGSVVGPVAEVEVEVGALELAISRVWAAASSLLGEGEGD